MKARRVPIILLTCVAALFGIGIGFASWLVINDLTINATFKTLADIIMVQVPPTPVDVIEDVSVDEIQYAEHYGFVWDDVYSASACLTGRFQFNIANAISCWDSFASDRTFDLEIQLSGFGETGLTSSGFQLTNSTIASENFDSLDHSFSTTTSSVDSSTKALVSTIHQIVCKTVENNNRFEISFALGISYSGSVGSGSASFPNLEAANFVIWFLPKECSV